jgi:CcmD family protein
MSEVPPDTFPYLFAAYTAIWVMVVIYLVSVGKKVTALERKLSVGEEDGSDISS